jgi:1-acyl-sn-glycerol-3-phosphate acyltransferase
MPEVWAPDRLYAVLRHYTDACTRFSYTRMQVTGSIPEDGAVILTPNHTNTLMDAMVLLRTRKGPTVFGARADIFRKPAANRALRFLKILPMTRARDGLHNVTDNYRTFEEIDDALAHGVPFCLFPEGTHHPGRELQPIRKGFARLAFASAASRKTYLVPVGINYGHFFRFRSSCELAFGQPIDVNAFLESHAESPEPERFQAIREELQARMQVLVNPQPPRRPSPWRRWLLLPLFPAAALLSLPQWLAAELIIRKIKDKAFANSVRFLMKLALTPLMLLVWALVFGLTLPWWAALGLVALYLCSYSIFYDVLPLFFDPLRKEEEAVENNI